MRKKRSFLEDSISKAKEEELQRVVDYFSGETGHNGKTHYEGIDCWFCNVVARLSEEALTNETPYTKGFKAGMAWVEAALIKGEK